MKRLFDIIVSMVGLVILAPLLGIIAFAIAVESRGGVLFRQERLGRGGRVFQILKFRTMVADAEKQGTGIFTYEGDPRITRVGKFLRETSLDELPQLWNVLKGDMALVGPRPPLVFHPYKFEDYPEKGKRRFEVRPGITGYAQVVGRNALSWDERIELDVWYVENQSWRLDLWILFRTIFEAARRDKIVRKSPEEDHEA